MGTDEHTERTTQRPGDLVAWRWCLAVLSLIPRVFIGLCKLILAEIPKRTTKGKALLAVETAMIAVGVAFLLPVVAIFVFSILVVTVLAFAFRVLTLAGMRVDRAIEAGQAGTVEWFAPRVESLFEWYTETAYKDGVDE